METNDQTGALIFWTMCILFFGLILTVTVWGIATTRHLGPNPPRMPNYHEAWLYAHDCGGRVTDPFGHHGGPYVEGCTR